MVATHFNILAERITIDPQICHGKPCIRGLRYPVEFILELLSVGMSPQEILANYEDLELPDIMAVLTREQNLPPMSGGLRGVDLAFA